MRKPAMAAKKRAAIPKSLPVGQRFEHNYRIDERSGCWIWQLAPDHFGYARFYIRGQNWRASRWSYEQFVGPIGDGLAIDHLCRNRLCVNPNHLDAVTNCENNRRKSMLPSELAELMRARSSNPDAGFEINDRSEVAE